MDILCYGDPANCFGYHGPHDRYTYLADNHDLRVTPAEGRQPCQAGDKRWAEMGRTACAIHREYGKDVA